MSINDTGITVTMKDGQAICTRDGKYLHVRIT